MLLVLMVVWQEAVALRASVATATGSCHSRSNCKTKERKENHKKEKEERYSSSSKTRERERYIWKQHGWFYAWWLLRERGFDGGYFDQSKRKKQQWGLFWLVGERGLSCSSSGMNALILREINDSTVVVLRLYSLWVWWVSISTPSTMLSKTTLLLLLLLRLPFHPLFLLLLLLLFLPILHLLRLFVWSSGTRVRVRSFRCRGRGASWCIFRKGIWSRWWITARELFMISLLTSSAA